MFADPEQSLTMAGEDLLLLSMVYNKSLYIPGMTLLRNAPVDVLVRSEKIQQYQVDD